MSLNQLAIRAKNSISGLLSFGDGQCSSLNSTDKRSQTAKENVTPRSAEFASQSVPVGSTWTDAKTSSTKSKNSPSRRVKLKESLRRIGSLRSIRSSPSKNAKRDKTPSPIEEPVTPPTQKCSIKPSLMLNFQQSPASQPMFEITTRRCSNSSSFFAHQSSPMTIPSTKQEASLNTPADSLILPDGTLPDSRAPIQIALSLDSTKLAPSPVSSPGLEINSVADSLLTPMPGTNLTFEELRPGFGLLASPAKVSQKRSGYFGFVLNQGCEEIYHSSYIHFDHEAAQEASTKALAEFVATCTENDIISSDPPTSNQCTMSYRKANGEEAHRQLPVASDDEALINKFENIVWDNNSDFDPTDQAAADTTVGVVRDGLSAPRISVDMANHASTWSHPIGLYDGSGYGDEMASVSRSSSTKETVEAPQATMWMIGEENADQCDAGMMKPRAAAMGATDDGSSLEDFIHAYSSYEGCGSWSVNSHEVAPDGEKDRLSAVGGGGAGEGVGGAGLV